MRRCNEKSPLAGGDVCRLPKNHPGYHAGYLRQWVGGPLNRDGSRPAPGAPAPAPAVQLEGQTTIEDVL